MDPYKFQEVKYNNPNKKLFFDSDTNSTIIFNNNDSNNWEKDFFNKTLDSRLQIADTIKEYPELNKFYQKNYANISDNNNISNYINKNYKELKPIVDEPDSDSYTLKVFKTANQITEHILTLEINLEELEQIKSLKKKEQIIEQDQRKKQIIEQDIVEIEKQIKETKYKLEEQKTQHRQLQQQEPNLQQQQEQVRQQQQEQVRPQQQEQVRPQQYRQEQVRQQQQEQVRPQQYRQEQVRPQQYRQEQVRPQQYRQEQVRPQQYRQEQQEQQEREREREREPECIKGQVQKFFQNIVNENNYTDHESITSTKSWKRGMCNLVNNLNTSKCSQKELNEIQIKANEVRNEYNCDQLQQQVGQPQFTTPPVRQPQVTTPSVRPPQFTTTPVRQRPVRQPPVRQPPVRQPQFTTPPVIPTNTTQFKSRDKQALETGINNKNKFTQATSLDV